MSSQYRVDSLNALIVSLILSTLSIILLFSFLSGDDVVSASQERTTLNSSTREAPEFPTAPTTTSVHITKTITPTFPDTGGVVSICYAISGLNPWNLDIVLVQDVSGSMNELVRGSMTQTRLAASQAAADVVVGSFLSTDRVAVISYSVAAHLVQPLTTTKNAVTETIWALTTTAGWTNIGESIWISHQELIASARYDPATAKVIVLLSDGLANCTEDRFCSDDPTTLALAADYARTQAMLATSDTIRIYTIGFGDDVGENLLKEIASIGKGKYFFAVSADSLETAGLTIASELSNLIITEVLTPGAEIDCSKWPDAQCTVNSSGATTLTLLVRNDLLTPDLVSLCFTATANLDPGYEGPINLPGSSICYHDPDEHDICVPFNGPAVTVGGRKITGYVFNDINSNGQQDTGETGVPGVIVRTSMGAVSSTVTVPTVSSTTNASGSCVLRTSSAPPISVTIEVPLGYIATTSTFKAIPAATGIYSVIFGIRAAPVYLPAVTKNYSPPPPVINGSFEDGWTGWMHGGELAQTITSTNYHLDSHSALLGDPAYICALGVPIGSAWMKQIFRVPYTKNPRLSFWYNIVTQDQNPQRSDNFDRFDVQINGVQVFRDTRTTGLYGCFPQGQQDLGWRFAEIDLSAYSGQYIIIQFENWNMPDEWYNTWTFVDDVQFVP